LGSGALRRGLETRILRGHVGHEIILGRVGEAVLPEVTRVADLPEKNILGKFMGEKKGRCGDALLVDVVGSDEIKVVRKAEGGDRIGRCVEPWD
jgi:hypothetical protein